ncbi:PIN domain-containing protein [Conexibacter sp. S30A1]|uniref:PIN domain-containing protein n=1 Tax=Conexibacter sp. S30A1 TaxID=2937800 RepID=UPI00200E1751|nr:PIN domain-containing protein [Conexibacter sp. S30A1]
MAKVSSKNEVTLPVAAMRQADAREAIAAMGIVVTPLTAVIGEHAAQLRATHGRLRPPDAIVLATARALGSKLLTYDDGLGRITGNGTGHPEPRLTADARNPRISGQRRQRA